MIEIKYNIGDKVRAKINYANDKRKEVEAIIKGVELVDNDTQVKYKIWFEPDEFHKRQGSTGCSGYINQDDIIEKIFNVQNIRQEILELTDTMLDFWNSLWVKINICTDDDITNIINTWYEHFAEHGDSIGKISDVKDNIKRIASLYYSDEN